MSKIYDMVIIGSGPAGLAAAIYGVRARLSLVVIEQEMLSGGQIVNTTEVDNYPGLPGISGFDIGDKFREHAEKLGASIVNDAVTGLRKLTEEEAAAVLEGQEGSAAYPLYRVECFEENYDAKTVVIASGAKHSILGVPGEETLTGMGVSYCATCDGAFYKGKVTAVVGGGDVALEDAIFLSRMCEKVYIIHRRDEFRGAKVLQEKLLSIPNIIPVYDSVITRVGDHSGAEMKVEEVTVRNVKTGEEKPLDIDGLFIAVGIVPNSDLFSLVERDPKGYIKAGEDCETSIPGIFAAGDVRTKQLRQVLTAASDGANAVTSAERYLNSLK